MPTRIRRFSFLYLYNSCFDGDYDDDGEAIVLSYKGLLNIFNIDAIYDNKHHSSIEEIPSNVKFVFGQFYFKSSHFVIINKAKKVIFDSFGASNTVMNGKLISMRWFYAN